MRPATRPTTNGQTGRPRLGGAEADGSGGKGTMGSERLGLACSFMREDYEQPRRNV